MDNINIQSPKITERKWLIYPALVISSLCLLIPAFYNHYPLVNPDTATYLASGFKPETPFDRPITYGLLIRLFSLNGLSLWFLVFAQAYIVSWLIFKIFKALSGNKPYILKSLLIVFLLSVVSGLSWIVSQVQPDVFTPVAFLCIIIILMDKEGRGTNFLLYCLFFIAVAVHLSHPLLMVITLLCLFIFSRIYTNKTGVRPMKQVSILIILSLGSIIMMGSALAKSKHVYFMGSLLQKGVLKIYLDDQCMAKNYKICKYKDVLPADVNEFWWNPNSPLYKIGGWQSTRPEFNDIINGIITSPAYLKLYLAASIKQVGEQTVTFNIGDGNQAFPPGSNVEQRVSEYFPQEATRFNNSRQNKSYLMEILAAPNKVFSIVIACSLLAFLYVFIKWKSLSKEMRLILLVCILGIFLNCLDCAAFGIVNGRYGCKMIWLIPFYIMAFIGSSLPSSKEKEVVLK